MRSNARTSKEANRFLPSPADALLIDTDAPADIYIRTGPGQFTLYSAKHTSISAQTLKRLQSKGVEEIYVAEKDTSAFYDYIEDNLRQFIDDEDFAESYSPSLIYENTKKLMKHLWENLESPAAMKRMATGVEATVTSILRNENALWDMLSMAGHDYYTHLHCINVSAILIAACRHILNLPAKELIEVGLGGMLHDIGKKQIPGNILKKPGRLTENEFEMIKKHPVMGLEFALEKHNLSPYTRDIIQSHHEQYEGNGYPGGDPAKHMTETIRLAKIVDVYDALTTHRSYARARTSFNAVKIMKNEMEGHFDPGLLKEFIILLGSRPNLSASV